MLDYIGSNKRQYERVRLQHEMKYRLKGSNSSFRDAVTVDISASGCQFQTNHTLGIGQILEIEILIPARQEDSFKMEARVMRMEEMILNEWYHVGVHFETITEKDRQLISEYIRRLNIIRLLEEVIRRNGSDLHLVAHRPPVLRIHGELLELEEPPLTDEDTFQIIYSLLNLRQIETFESTLELDFAFSLPKLGRFRVNVHREQGFVEAAIRVISSKAKSISELNLPAICYDFSRKHSGLLLVAGTTGSGKSHTMAAMVNQINQERRAMIISMEDPIEYIYGPGKSIIKQREIGVDSKSFNNALKHVLRQDPDVILVGEMRDFSSVESAIKAAETGHLVFSTLHTRGAVETLSRIVNMFPADQQQNIRYSLAHSLNGIISQMLVPKKSGDGRVLLTEILVMVDSVKRMIFAGKFEEINDLIELGDRYGMHSFRMEAKRLIRENQISEDILKTF